MAEGDIRKSDGEIYYGSEYNSMSFKLASGTVTLQSTTDSYDTDYVDISIGAGDLIANDIIQIHLMTKNTDSAYDVMARVDISGTSSTGTLMSEGSIANQTDAGMMIIGISQDGAVNDQLNAACVCSFLEASTSEGSLDTNDANIFTTAFTIRLNFKWSAAASQAANVRYVATVIRG